MEVRQLVFPVAIHYDIFIDVEFHSVFSSPLENTIQVLLQQNAMEIIFYDFQ